MKTLLITLLIISNQCIGQIKNNKAKNIYKIVNNESINYLSFLGDTMQCSSLNTENIYFKKQLLCHKIFYIDEDDTCSKKIKYEFIKIDNVHFKFISYNLLGINKEEGVVVFDNNLFSTFIDTVKSYDLDGNIINNVIHKNVVKKFIKTDKWTTQLTNNIVLQGNYINNKMQGIWTETLKINWFDSVTNRILHYNNNNIVKIDTINKALNETINLNLIIKDWILVEKLMFKIDKNKFLFYSDIDDDSNSFIFHLNKNLTCNNFIDKKEGLHNWNLQNRVLKLDNNKQLSFYIEYLDNHLMLLKLIE